MSRDASRDQADGLRRILAGKRTRQLCFLSAVPPAQKNALLLNLAAALVRSGSEVQILDASQCAQGISSRAMPALQASLWDVAQQGDRLDKALREHEPGIRLARLSSQPLQALHAQPAELARLSQLLREMSPAANFWLLDTDLNADNPFVLPALSSQEVIVLVANTPTSIKEAYTAMKEFQARCGRRPYQLLVLGASVAQTRMIGKNMALAANRYLASPLIALGNLPADEHWSRSVQLGRAIVDAFPMASASIALRQIAQRLLDAQTPEGAGRQANAASPAALEA